MAREMAHLAAATASEAGPWRMGGIGPSPAEWEPWGFLTVGKFFLGRTEVRTQPVASKRQKLNGRAMWRHDLGKQFFLYNQQIFTSNLVVKMTWVTQKKKQSQRTLTIQMLA